MPFFYMSLKKKRSKRFVIALSILILIVGIAFIPTPYYLYQPGPMDQLSSDVTVQGGHKTEKGHFYLTTVLTTPADNLYVLIYGFFAPHTQIKKVQDVKGNLSDTEYDHVLTHMMKTSQQSAIVAGLREAGEDVTIHHDGVFVNEVTPTSKAKGIIDVGDIILAVDGQPVDQTTDFTDYMASKHIGDTVRILFTHNGIRTTKSIELTSLTKDKVGIGIAPEDEFSIVPSRQVKMNVGDIGGPSAGLMFSLEILNQTIPEDLTKGYKIAGTGTIDLDGNVGQIGGIRDKITAAAQEGVDIFFCPADRKPGDTNEKDVKDEAKKQGYSVKIVPVKTIHDAIAFLHNLSTK